MEIPLDNICLTTLNQMEGLKKAAKISLIAALSYPGQINLGIKKQKNQWAD